MRKGLVLLSGAGRGAALDALLRRGVAHINNRPPRIAVSLAAIGGRREYASRVLGAFDALGAIVERFAVEGEEGAQPPDEARAIVERADLIFLSGGDPVAGAELLAAAGADAWLREANARGAACAGGSAGAIMLAAYWARWPDEPPADAAFDGGELVRCAGVAHELVVDCHAEEDEWAELALVREMLAAQARRDLRFLGLPSGGAVIVHPDGALEPIGAPPFELR